MGHPIGQRGLLSHAHLGDPLHLSHVEPLAIQDRRAWIAIRDNDIAAETMGVNIVLYKLLAFFVAGFFGGLQGPSG